MRTTLELEVCANGYESALAAQLGGADRVELCDNLQEGGTTPSYGQIRLCKQQLTIAIWPIIRPRGGDFLYSDDEFQIMLDDVSVCKQLNCDGIVTGILTADGHIDEARMLEIISMAHPLPVAFHRAFDMTQNMNAALETLIKLGIVRVLSSGGAENALSGAEVLRGLVKQAQGRIALMPGSGITVQNIETLIASIGAPAYHTSAKVQAESMMQYRNDNATMARDNNAYGYGVTDANLVELMVDQLKKY
jgi:copper homeostasis protein